MDARVENFIVGHNYQLQEVIGEGAYGIVWYVATLVSLNKCCSASERSYVPVSVGSLR